MVKRNGTNSDGVVLVLLMLLILLMCAAGSWMLHDLGEMVPDTTFIGQNVKNSLGDPPPLCKFKNTIPPYYISTQFSDGQMS